MPNHFLFCFLSFLEMTQKFNSQGERSKKEKPGSLD